MDIHNFIGFGEDKHGTFLFGNHEHCQLMVHCEILTVISTSYPLSTSILSSFSLYPNFLLSLCIHTEFISAVCASQIEKRIPPLSSASVLVGGISLAFLIHFHPCRADVISAV